MQSKPTPLLNHLPADVWTTVYEPDEDTFLLLDALEAEEEFLRMRDPHVCVEVGCVPSPLTYPSMI